MAKDCFPRVGNDFAAPLLFARRWTEQRMIAVAHQRHTRLNQANDSAAQVVGFPGALGDAS